MQPESIRQATLDDVGTLLDMMEPFNAFERIPWTRGAAETPLRTLLSDISLGVVGIVEQESSPIGYFVVTWNYDLEWAGRDAFLTELFLVPEARGRGLGRTVLGQAEAFARKHGARALHLVVRPENERAHDLYLRAGFVHPGRVLLTKVFAGESTELASAKLAE
jgi:ribosomal protein S18 acetylase RimI-like enzyme